MNFFDRLKRLKRQGTGGPWDWDGTGYTIVGGKAPKKAHHAYKNTICQVPMADQITGLLSAKERDANLRRIEQLPDLEDKFIEAKELLDKFAQAFDDEDLLKEYKEFMES